MIEYRDPHSQKYVYIKIIAWIIIITFSWQQISFGLDYSSFGPASPLGGRGLANEIGGQPAWPKGLGNRQPVDAGSAHNASENLLSDGTSNNILSDNIDANNSDDGSDTVDITNYDIFSYKGQPSGIQNLLPSEKDQEQSGTFSPNYIKSQQRKHETISRQKEDMKDLVEQLMNRGMMRDRDEAEIELKKKTGGEDAPQPEARGGVYYTLEDYDSEGNPRQLNAYIYEGDTPDGVLLEIVSYDISGLDTSVWTATAEEIETEDGFLRTDLRYR